jgi:hypothetical protein
MSTTMPTTLARITTLELKFVDHLIIGIYF